MMPILARSLLAAALAALPLLSLQAEEDQRWFQVELLVVAHTSPEALRAEYWDPLPVLAYPERLRFLLDPERLQANLNAIEGADYSEVDARGLQRIHLQPRWQPAGLPSPVDDAEADAAVDGLAPDTAGPLAAGVPAAAGGLLEPTTAATDGPAPADADAEVSEPPPRLPTPFVQLPASAREFRGKAAYMERNGPYRVLFHETWWQPVASEGAALPLLLDRSGDTASYPALQGTITLYLSRFLHLETNLWLNTDGSYLPGSDLPDSDLPGSDLPGSWRMPAPPLGPVSLETVEAPLVAPELAEIIDLVGYDPAWEAPEEPLVAALPDYPWRHAVLVQQQRRMRSGEVHYIDHPLLGLVVKITPLDAEDLQQADYDAAILPLLQRPEPPAGSPAAF